jgi:signal peptidase I
LLIDKLTPRFAPYGRGDIVVLQPPATEDTTIPFIKRVIGLGGEHVVIKDGHVLIDGRVLDEPYLGPDIVTLPKGVRSWDVDDGYLLVMGDNREDSEDGRMFGEIPETQVIGRAWVRFWPVDGLLLFGRPDYPGLRATLPPDPRVRLPPG